MNYQDLKQFVITSIAQDNFNQWLQIIPQLNDLSTTPQDPLHHGEGDVWTHTQMVLRALITQRGFTQLTDDDQFVLFMSALLHDIAKPATTIIDPITGRISQPGHAKKGEIISRILLWQMGVPFTLREQICRIIREHQVPFFALAELKNNFTPAYIVHRLSWQLPIWMLCMLAQADIQGRICNDKQRLLDEVELFKYYAQEQNCLSQPKYFADDYTRVRYFRGANVLPEYSLYPSTGSNVILMAGLPAVGKNTWIMKHYPNLPVASYDDARVTLKLKHGQNEGMVIQYVLAQVKQWLRNKQDFVWNATHLSRDIRQKALDLLYAYQANVHIVYLEQPEQTLYRRNIKRDTSLSNSKLQLMFNKWEIPLPTEAHQVSYIINQGE